MGVGYLHTYIHVGVVGVEKTRRGIKFVPGLRCSLEGQVCDRKRYNHDKDKACDSESALEQSFDSKRVQGNMVTILVFRTSALSFPK